MSLGYLTDRARRQDDAIMLLELASRRCERQIRPQVRDHPLQRQRAAPVLYLGALGKRTPPPRPSRYGGSSTSMSPKVRCQRSFFTLAPNSQRPLQLIRPFDNLPVRPVPQQLSTEPAHLFDNAALRLVGFAQVIPSVLDKIDQALDPPAQLRVLVQSGQQALVCGRRQSVHRRYWYL